MATLRIRRMHNRYRLSNADDAVEVQRTLDRAIEDRLPPLLDRGFENLRRRLGLAADSLVAVRRLNLRIRLSSLPLPIDPRLLDHIAHSWSGGLLEGLERVLVSAGLRTHRVLVSDMVVIFPDVSAARFEHLRQLVREGTTAWWSKALLGAEGTAQALPDALLSLAEEGPEAVADCIVRLVADLGPGWLARLDAKQRRHIGSILIRAGTTRVGNGDVTRGGPGASALPLDKLSPSQRRDIRQCVDAGSAAMLYCAYALTGQQPVPGSFEKLEQEAARWLDLSRAGGVDKPDGATGVEFATPTSPSGATHAIRQEEVFSKAPARSDDIDAQTSPDISHAAVESRSNEIEPSDSATTRVGASSVPVGCGGLLFLIRFALRNCEQGKDINEAMLALGTQVLDSVFQHLSPAGRRAAWRRDMPLLQVFAGLREPIADVAALDHPPDADRWARTTQEAVLRRIDADVTAAPRGREYVLGGVKTTLSPLDKLLLRPGRLQVSDTEARLLLPADAVQIGVRRGGWDIDPGWVPALGRVIRFEYVGQ